MANSRKGNTSRGLRNKGNESGREFEAFIEAQLVECGYEVVDRNEFFDYLADDPIYSREVNIDRTIYDAIYRCDFLLYHPIKWPNCLVIEAKWQKSGGTVDEKYPYLVLNIKKSPYKTILLLDGGGYRRGAERWVRSQVGEGLLHVFNAKQFLDWISQGNL